MTHIRVGVLGYKPKQFRLIEQRSPGNVELHFLGGADTPLHRGGPSRLDAIVFNTRFAAHKQQDYLESKYGPGKIHLVSGGLGAAVAKLRELA